MHLQVCVPTGQVDRLLVASPSSQVTLVGGALPAFDLVLSGEAPTVNLVQMQTQNLTILAAG